LNDVYVARNFEIKLRKKLKILAFFINLISDM